jgi:hypothetical protein
VQEGKRKSKKLKYFKDGKNGDNDTNFNKFSFKNFKDIVFNGNDESVNNCHNSKHMVNTSTNKVVYRINKSNNKSKNTVGKVQKNVNFTEKGVNDVINIHCNCSISDLEADKGVSRSDGRSLEQEGHDVTVQGKINECAHYANISNEKVEKISRISLTNSGLGDSMGSECDIATQIIHSNQGKGQSIELVAEERLDTMVHSLGNCEQKDWKSNNLVLSQDINDKESLIERDVSQFVMGEFKNGNWDLENPIMDLEDPNIGGLYGELPQRLNYERCTNVPRFGFIPLQCNIVRQGPENQQLTAQQLWGKKSVNDIGMHNYNKFQELA